MDAFFVLVGKIVAAGGGVALIAYYVFQHLGEKWIENRFSQRLEQLRHQQALELQRLRVQIDALLSGAIKLQEREFVVLPEAWAKLDEAHGLVSWLASPLQQYAPIDRMNSAQLEELLAQSEFTESQKDEVRRSDERGKKYQEILFWYRLNKVKSACGELQKYIARNGIFLPFGLKEKFSKISDVLWGAIVSIEVGHEAQDWGMKREAWAQVKDESEPLYDEIETEIHARLQSHGSASQLSI